MNVSPGRDEFISRNIPYFPSPERAVAAMKAMYDYSTWLQRPPRILTRFLVNRRRVMRIINRHVKLKQYQVGEAEAKSILRAYHFNVPPGDIATTVEDIMEIGEKIGYPIAMKFISKDIVHKFDAGVGIYPTACETAGDLHATPRVYRVPTGTLPTATQPTERVRKKVSEQQSAGRVGCISTDHICYFRRISCSYPPVGTTRVSQLQFSHRN